MAKQVLEGIRVLDFTWAAAGPFGTGLLARNGAEVIKVESIKRLDGVRSQPPLVGDGPPNNSAYFGNQSASKYSIALNVADPRGLDIAKRLVRLSDVVVENYRTGAMKRMGLGFDVLKSIKPDIIMISSSVLGDKGASWAFGGFAPHGSALAGYLELTGFADSPPVFDGVAYSDYIQSVIISMGAMVALDYRRRTGEGQWLDLSHLDALVQFISPAILDYGVNKRQPSRMGNRSLNASPHGAFPCQGEDKWCVMAVFSDDEWRNLCQVMGKPAWTKAPRFATLASRKKNEDELERLIGEWTINYPPDEVMTKLQQAGVAAGVVQDMGDIMDRDPQIKARDFFVKVKHPVIGEHRVPVPPFKLSRNSFNIRPAPRLGEHNDYVYRQLLGLSDSEFAELSAAGIFA